MDKNTGREDADALLGTVRAGAARDAAAALNDTDVYNFSRAGQISNEQMRAIATVNDMFARNLMHNMGAWLRTDFQVTLLRGEQMEYSECLQRMADRALISSVRLEPLGATGLLEIESTLVSPIVDVLLGGTGKSEAPRMLTDIEELIMASVLNIILKELNVAWQPVGLQLALEKRESISNMSRMMPGSEKALYVGFAITMPEARGNLTLCLPAVVLNSILRKLVADRDRPRRRPDDVRLRVRELVGETQVGSVLQFPPVRLSARQIAQLAPGYVLRLPVPRHAAAELRVGGVPLGRARPVKLGEHRGACMEPLETPGAVRTGASA